MKREILFRGKRIDNSQWIEGGFFKHLNRTLCAMGDCEKPEDIDYLILKSGFSDWNMPKPLEAHPVIPSTVGQFTGLTDKNGVKIFEGDVLQRIDTKSTKIVLWKKDCFVARNLFDTWLNKIVVDREQDCSLYFMTTFDIEVIGNIHDNHEII
jgi:uncharacterized phage protein (TIGR01671 family)